MWPDRRCPPGRDRWHVGRGPARRKGGDADDRDRGQHDECVHRDALLDPARTQDTRAVFGVALQRGGAGHDPLGAAGSRRRRDRRVEQRDVDRVVGDLLSHGPDRRNAACECRGRRAGSAQQHDDDHHHDHVDDEVTVHIVWMVSALISFMLRLLPAASGGRLALERLDQLRGLRLDVADGVAQLLGDLVRRLQLPDRPRVVADRLGRVERPGGVARRCCAPSARWS